MLRFPRFYLANSLNQITDTEQIKQITRVFRLNINDQIIGIYEGKEYLLKIIKLDKACLELETIKEIANNKELPFNLRAFLPLLKGEKNDFILQKLTEIGICEFCFVQFEYSVKQISNLEHKVQRWQKIILEAVEQSERTKVPSIQFCESLKQIKLNPLEDGFAFVERLENKILDWDLFKNANSKALIFGPEGGFSPSEKLQIQQKGFINISLGQRILRAETAIILGTGLCTINF